MPQTTRLRKGLTNDSRNAAPRDPEKLGSLEHVEPQRCHATHVPTMQSDRRTAKRLQSSDYMKQNSSASLRNR
jgi:hypothetical protein